MKNLGFISGLLFIALISTAQNYELSETLVQSPKFNYDAALTNPSNASPICQYMQTQLANQEFYEEGMVVVLFTISADGSLTDFILENSVSSTTDKAVMKSIKSTSGMWSAGHVNNEPVDMQRKIYIRFLGADSESLEILAQEHVHLAIKKYYSAIELKNSLYVSSAKAEKKAQRKLNESLKLLAKANTFQPDEPAIAFWQACAYEQAGNELMKNEKLNEFTHLVDNNYSAQNDLIDIVLK